MKVRRGQLSSPRGLRGSSEKELPSNSEMEGEATLGQPQVEIHWYNFPAP